MAMVAGSRVVIKDTLRRATVVNVSGQGVFLIRDANILTGDHMDLRVVHFGVDDLYPLGDYLAARFNEGDKYESRSAMSEWMEHVNSKLS